MDTTNKPARQSAYPSTLSQVGRRLYEDEEAPDLLLNQYSGAVGAFSLRKLDKDYSGSAIRVRRDSDNDEQDIGFDGNDLDTSSLESFADGGDAFVTIWYDQSGEGNDAEQSSASEQPQIVSGGSVIKENDRIGIDFDGDNDYMNMALNSFSGDVSIYACIYPFSLSTPSRPNANIIRAGNDAFLIVNSSASEFRSRFSGDDFINGNINTDEWISAVVVHNDSTTTRTHYKNGTKTGDESVSSNTSSGRSFAIATDGESPDGGFDGLINSIVVWNTTVDEGITCDS